MSRTTFYSKEFKKNLIGRTITAVVNVDVGGDIFPGLTLDNGSILTVQADAEGNAGGFMALESKDGEDLGCGGAT
jgi:hypothetical protein